MVTEKRLLLDMCVLDLENPVSSVDKVRLRRDIGYKMRGEEGGLPELSSNSSSLTLTSRERQHRAWGISFAHGGCLVVLGIVPSSPVGAGYGICPLQTLCAFMVLSLVKPPVQTDHRRRHSLPPARPSSCTLIVINHQLGHWPPNSPLWLS